MKLDGRQDRKIDPVSNFDRRQIDNFEARQNGCIPLGPPNFDGSQIEWIQLVFSRESTHIQARFVVTSPPSKR